MSSESTPQRAPLGRHAARQRAVELCYEADHREGDAVRLVASRRNSPHAEPVADYTVTLVEGVSAHLEYIDELLSEHAHGWLVDRMPALDRAVLRIGTYEILWAADVPDAVAIDEAVGLARALSTEDSPRFVNGVLGRIGTIADKLRAVL